MQKYLEVFEALKREQAAALQTQHGLTIKTGEALGAAILKLLKPSWTTDGPHEILNTNGLFFSMWVDAECEAKGILRYNVHAKKLRFIKGEKFAAREFVRLFRAGAKAELSQWPNCNFPKGPITLFQGDIQLRLDTLHDDATKLMDRFVKLAPMLDRMMAA